MVCTTNVCATIVPVAVKEPDIVCDPANTFDPVVAYDPVLASFDTILAANEPDAVINCDAVASVEVIRDDSDEEKPDTSVGNPAIEPENEPVIPAVDEIEPVTEIPPLSMMRPFFMRNCAIVYYFSSLSLK